MRYPLNFFFKLVQFKEIHVGTVEDIVHYGFDFFFVFHVLDEMSGNNCDFQQGSDSPKMAMSVYAMVSFYAAGILQLKFNFQFHRHYRISVFFMLFFSSTILDRSS
jgi:hypothetical protein